MTAPDDPHLLRSVADICDGTYRYKTFELEALIEPKAVGALIAIRTRGAPSAVTYVAGYVDGHLSWIKIEEIDLPKEKP